MIARTVVAAALLALSLPSFASSGDADAGRKKSAPCAACHGQNGVSASPEFPNLAGQYADYLQTALTHYKVGKRKAAYFSSQKGLQVKH